MYRLGVGAGARPVVTTERIPATTKNTIRATDGLFDFHTSAEGRDLARPPAFGENTIGLRLAPVLEFQNLSAAPAPLCLRGRLC